MVITDIGRVLMLHKGAYNADTTYEILDVVTSDGSSYLCIQAGVGKHPVTETAYWALMAERGNTGGIGPQGKAYTILGSAYATLAALQAAITNPAVGDQYNVGASAPYHIYRWTGVAWEDQDQLEGPPGPAGPAGQDAVPRQTFVIELPAEDWSEDAPFTQTVEIEEMTADTDFIVDVILSDTLATAIDERKSYAYIDQAEGADGEVTFTCLSVKPAVDLTLQVRSV